MTKHHFLEILGTILRAPRKGDLANIAGQTGRRAPKIKILMNNITETLQFYKTITISNLAHKHSLTQKRNKNEKIPGKTERFH